MTYSPKNSLVFISYVKLKWAKSISFAQTDTHTGTQHKHTNKHPHKNYHLCKIHEIVKKRQLRSI